MSNAEDAANACRGNGDLETLGRCLSTYWEQKKRMAPGEWRSSARARRNGAVHFVGIPRFAKGIVDTAF